MDRIAIWADIIKQLSHFSFVGNCSFSKEVINAVCADLSVAAMYDI